MSAGIQYPTLVGIAGEGLVAKILYNINNTKTIYKSCLVITESIDITITAVNIVARPTSITIIIIIINY